MDAGDVALVGAAVDVCGTLSDVDVVLVGDVTVLSSASLAELPLEGGGGLLLWTFMCFLRELG